MLDFIPSSEYFSLNLIPDFPSWREAVTSSRVLPRQEVIPIPVTTTRRSAMERTVVVDLAFVFVAAVVYEVKLQVVCEDREMN